MKTTPEAPGPTYSASERGYLLFLAQKLGEESAEARAAMTPPPTITLADATTLSEHAMVSTRARVISPDLWRDLLVAYGTVTRQDIGNA